MKILLTSWLIVALLTQSYGGMVMGTGSNSTLRLHPDGLSTITFDLTGASSRVGGGYVVPLQTLRFNEDERLEVAYSEGANVDGGEAISAHGPLVQITFDVVVYGTTRPDMISNVNALMLAVTNQKGGTLEFQPEDVSTRATFYRYEQSALPKLKSGQRWDAPQNSAGLFPIQLEIALQTHPFCISDPDNPIVAVGATTVYNQDDGVAGYVSIGSSIIKGTIEALTQLRLRNMVANAAIGKLFYFRRSQGTLSNFNPILEGGTPDADSEIWWSTESDSTRRSNNYQRYAPPTAANNLWAYLSYDISYPGDHEGRVAVAVVCRSLTEEASTWDLKATIEVGSVEMETDVENPAKVGAWHVAILGELEIPPTPISVDESYSPTLKIYVRRTTGDATQMLDVDFVMLIYVDEYPQQVIIAGGFTNAYRLLMENFVEELCHVVDQSTLAFEKTAEPVASLLQLKPQTAQRLYFIWERHDVTVEDDLEDYEAWRWVKVADFETDESWSGVGDSVDTTYYVEGSQGRRVTASGPGGESSSRLTFDPPQDFTKEGRFTDDDYVYVAFYVPNIADSYVVAIMMETNYVLHDYYFKQWVNTSLTAGWNFMKVKKSDMGSTGSPTWSSIESVAIAIAVASGTHYVTFDDWRIVRADPDDSTKGNETGAVWDFMRDVWHVEELDSADHALGCIDVTAGLEQVALIHEEPSPSVKYLAKVRAKRDNGDVGIVFRCADGTSGSEDMAALFIDTTNDQLELRKWAAGSPSDIATAVSQTTAPDVNYYLGVQVVCDTIRCYFGTSLAAIWNSTTKKFVESARKFDVTDSDFASGGPLATGQCGLLSIGTLGRFNDVKLYGVGEHVPGDTIQAYLPVIFRSFAPFGD